MAIKRRTDPVTEARIEAFGAGAELSASAPITAPGPAKPARATTSRTTAPRLEDVAKTFLIRYPDETLPRLLAEVAQLEDRSQHAVALRALRQGLEAMKANADS